MEKEKRGINLYAVLVVFLLVPLILSISVISILSSYMMKSNLEKDSENTLMIVANNLASYCYDNEITAMNAANYYDYIDSLKAYDIEMAIIAEGIPCTTSIKNENDYRVREIALSLDIEADSAILENGYYDKNVIVDGHIYYAYYVPIKADGRIIAVAFAGKLQKDVIGAIKNVNTMFALLAFALVAISIVLILLFSRRLSKLFDMVVARIRALSGGQLGKQKEQVSFVKEMNKLFASTDSMQGELASIIGKVKNVSGSLTRDIVEVNELSEGSTVKANQITVSMEQLSSSSITMDENVQNISGKQYH